MVSSHVSRLVSIASKEGVVLVESLQSVETFYLEYLGLPVYHFSLEGPQCRLWVEEERPGGEAEISLTETFSPLFLSSLYPSYTADLRDSR